ncbi:ribbon-helix-helix protein, CopG family (plasmid) [Halorutilales archaeon Cl-col2-1]
MKKVSVSLTEDQLERLDVRQDEGDASSRSEALRQILDEYEDLRQEYEDLRKECERLENRRDELRNQLQARGNVEAKVDELAEHQERQDKALAQVLEEQRRGVLGRAKVWLLGESRDDDEDRGERD